MDINIAVALVSGLAGSLIGVLVAMWKERKQFESGSELQRRESRIPVIQKLWCPLQPLSFFGKAQNERSEMLSKISDDLTDWYFKIGGLYISKTSQDFYVHFQESIELIMSEYDKRDVRINELSHAQFHQLRLEASALRSLTARDCGTRIETDSQYGKDAEENIQTKLKKCEECNPQEKANNAN